MLELSLGPGSTQQPSELAARARRLIDQTDATLRSVEAAAGRLEEGRYGTCETCGAPIPSEELVKDPTVRHCRAHHGSD